MVDIGKMTMPAVAGGVVAGILSGFTSPLCCCIGYIGGGAIAAWIYMNNVGRIELNEGAIVGAISGAIAGAIATILNAIFTVLFGSVINSMVSDMGGYMAYSAAEGGVMSLLCMPAIMIVGAIFGAIGGVIVAKIKE